MKWLPIKVSSSDDKATAEWCQTFYPEHLVSTNYFSLTKASPNCSFVTVRETLIAEEHGRCHQIQKTHVRERSSCPFQPPLANTLNNLVRWTMIEKNAHKSCWNSLRAHSSFLKNPHHVWKAGDETFLLNKSDLNCLRTSRWDRYTFSPWWFIVCWVIMGPKKQLFFQLRMWLIT